MKKINNSGFGVVEIILAALLIAAIIGAVWMISSRDSDESQVDNDSATEQQETTSNDQDSDNSEGSQSDSADQVTYNSTLTDLSINYPSDWVARDPNPEVFTNSSGGESLNFTLYSEEPTREPGGVGAPNPSTNIYMCLSISEYKGEWIGSRQSSDNETNRESFETSGKSLDIVTYDGQSLTDGIINLESNGNNDVSTTGGAWVNVTAQLNCTQSDGEILETSKERFDELPETQAAKEIIKTLKF